MLFRIIFILALLVGLQNPLAAQSASQGAGNSGAESATGKIGFVDIEIVIEQSVAIRMAMESMDKDLANRAREIDAKEREFRSARFELDKQERLLSTPDRQERRRNLVKLQEEIDEMKFNFEQELRSRERQIEPILEKIMGIVADVADEEGYDLILRGEVVIYGRSTVDVTDEVIQKLDSDVAAVMQLFKGEEKANAKGQAPEDIPQNNSTNSSSVREVETEDSPNSSDESSNDDTHTMTPVQSTEPENTN
jgi:outer membrane protein